MATGPINPNTWPLGFTRISVTGFKSLATKTDVEIRPLTVLAGANSSGKSSLMQPLLLMKQTLECDFVPAGPFLLSGPYLQFTETRQFLSRAGALNGSRQSFSLEFSFSGSTTGLAFSAGPEGGLSIAETWGVDAAYKSEWRLSKKLTADELNAMLLKLGSVPQWTADAGLTDISVQDAGFYQSVLYSVPGSTGQKSMNMQGRELYFMQENLELNALVLRMIYVRGLRGSGDRKELLAEITEHGFFQGSFERYVPSLIERWKLPGLWPKKAELVEGLTLLDLASDINTEKLNESEIEVRVPRTLNSASGDFVNIADVGLAVSTVLPVLVALIQAGPGQLVYIEQPELHLHPRAQWRLAQLLARAASRGVRLVIETHSSLLLQGILTCIAKGDISRDNVALHWFARNENGVTQVTTANVDSEGRVGNWPADFDDVELKASNEYLDAVESKLMASKGIE